MNEEANNNEARIKAIVALTQVQTEATEVHERYSLLIMGFVGVLAGYFFGPTKAPLNLEGYEYSSAVLIIASLACSVPAFWVGHITALMRRGFQSSGRLEKILKEFDSVTQREAMDAAGRWFYAKVPWIDSFLVGKPLLESGKSWEVRLEAACGRMIALGSWQSLFMRLQLMFAVGATIALVLARV